MDIFRVLKVDKETLLLVSFGVDDNRIPASSFLFKPVKLHSSSLFGNYLVDTLEIFYKLLLVLEGYILKRIPDMMNDT